MISRGLLVGAFLLGDSDGARGALGQPLWGRALRVRFAEEGVRCSDRQIGRRTGGGRAVHEGFPPPRWSLRAFLAIRRCPFVGWRCPEGYPSRNEIQRCSSLRSSRGWSLPLHPLDVLLRFPILVPPPFVARNAPQSLHASLVHPLLLVRFYQLVLVALEPSALHFSSVE